MNKTHAKYGAKIPAAPRTGPAGPMADEPTAHIKPSAHSTAQVDGFLDMVEGNVERTPGAGSPAIKPNENVAEDGKPLSDTPRNPRV